ncbi:MAG: uracil-DNA glycosylase [Gammaproteobacteria bacterium]|nr:uracil-DNA glycosylase [Gammaproteobacteria bacterium]
MTTGFHLNTIDPSWQPIIQSGLNTIDTDYIQQLKAAKDWLPGRDKIFNAFSLPVDQVKYVLFGESPYPRAQSANGYAFWDAAVSDIWSPTGLSKAVNRATSLRNIIKMLLIAEGLLSPNHTSQADIAAVDKSHLVQTISEFFGNFIQHGILLLNASLVLQPSNVRKDARAWRPFLKHTMDHLLQKKPDVQFILLGNIANEIDPLIPQPGIKKFYAEHPYNISFIHNPEVLKFFKPLHLLRSKQ